MLVLIVEDEPADAVLMARSLARAGHQSRRASSVGAALELCAAHDFDAVITDISLPGKSGHELIAELRGKGYARPILVVSGADDPNAVVRAMRDGASDYLVKALDSSHLQMLGDRLTEAVYRLALEKDNERLRQVELAFRIMEEEVEILAHIQTSMLPSQCPSREGYAFASHYAAARKVAGDYYDFFSLPDDRLGVLLADASGHGIVAAVVMATMRVIVHTLPCSLYPPADMLRQVNDRLAQHLLDEQFVTAAYAVLDEQSGQMEYALAGHPAPLVLRSRTGTLERTSPTGGLPLGVLVPMQYSGQLFRLEPGDKAFFYTDGLLDIYDRLDRETFGLQRLAEALRIRAGLDPEAIKQQLIEMLLDFSGGRPFDDDVTFVIVGRCCSDLLAAGRAGPPPAG